MSALAGDPKFRKAAEKPLRAVHKANTNVRRGVGHQGWKGMAVQEHGAGWTCGPPETLCCPAVSECMPRPMLVDRPAPWLTLQALLLESVDRSTGREVGSKRGVGAGTDSYYEYLIKWVEGLVLGRACCEGPARHLPAGLLVCPPRAHAA